MQNDLSIPHPAKCRHILVPGHHHAMPENAVRGGQRSEEHWFSKKIRHKLVPAEAPPQPGGHDDAAQISIGGVQINEEYIVPADKFLEKRRILLPNHGGDLRLPQQSADGIAVVRAAAFQIADLVDGDPRRMGALLQRWDSQSGKSG